MTPTAGSPRSVILTRQSSINQGRVTGPSTPRRRDIRNWARVSLRARDRGDLAPPNNTTSEQDRWPRLPPTASGFYYSPDSLNGRAQTFTAKTAQPLAHLGLVKKWDGRLSLPTAHYASPNQSALANSHPRAFHSLDSSHAPEYPGDSFQPYPAEAGSRLSVTSGNALRAFSEWITLRGGLPNPPPRSFTDEVALCRTGFTFAVIAQGRFATASTGHRTLPRDSIFSSGSTA